MNPKSQMEHMMEFARDMAQEAQEQRARDRAKISLWSIPIAIGEVDRLIWLLYHPHAPRPPFDDLESSATEDLQGRPSSITAQLTTELVGHLGRRGIRHCRVCGCTDDYACFGGCGWSADPEVCDRCV